MFLFLKKKGTNEKKSPNKTFFSQVNVQTSLSKHDSAFPVAELQ